MTFSVIFTEDEAVIERPSAFTTRGTCAMHGRGGENVSLITISKVAVLGHVGAGATCLLARGGLVAF